MAAVGSASAMPSGQRHAAWLALIAASVAAAHLWLADTLAVWARDAGRTPPAIKRLEIAFVREMQPAAPPLAATVAPSRAAVKPPRTQVTMAALPEVASAVALAASAADAAASAPPPPEPEVAAAQPVEASAPVPPPPAGEPAVVASAATEAPAAASAPAGAVPGLDATAAALPAFEWPLSTRLRYRVSGYYRGPVEGQAEVQWLREGQRYQVLLDVSIGPFFAPLVTRRMTSDGALSAQGLVPQRYDEETQVAFRQPRRRQLSFDGDRVRLADGQVVARPPGMQDSASQFVQMTWWFTTRPDRLRPGQTIEIPLALPSRVEPWLYDIVAAEPVATPVGVLETVHIKPRRAPRAGGDLVVESWIAPSLLYLPVRIVIRQDAETYVDLLLSSPPEQAAPAQPAASAPALRSTAAVDPGR